MPLCPNCDDHYFQYNPSSPFEFENKRHVCPPVFECSEADDDWHDCYAWTHQEAAKKIAEKWDNYDADGPRERTILVREKGQRTVKKFEVCFEYRIKYDAEEITYEPDLSPSPDDGFTE